MGGEWRRNRCCCKVQVVRVDGTPPPGLSHHSVSMSSTCDLIHPLCDICLELLPSSAVPLDFILTSHRIAPFLARNQA